MYVLLSILIGIAFWTDARRSLIPNGITMSGVATGLLYHSWADGWPGLAQSLLGLAAGFAVLVLLYALGALGAGDVKLFAAIGAITGFTFVLYSMMYSILYAGVIGIILLVWKRQLLRRGLRLVHWLFLLLIHRDAALLRTMKHQDTLRFPFMYAVLPGVLTAGYYLHMG